MSSNRQDHSSIASDATFRKKLPTVNKKLTRGANKKKTSEMLSNNNVDDYGKLTQNALDSIIGKQQVKTTGDSTNLERTNQRDLEETRLNFFT